MKHILVLLCLLLPISAFAQTPLKWNETNLDWTQPAALVCSDGSPATDCPITGYRIETAPNCTATTWDLVANLGLVFTYKATALTAGPHCFRAKSLSSNGRMSDASPIGPRSAATNVPPQPPIPSAVVTSDVVAYEYKPTTKAFVFVGYAPKGSECGPQLMVTPAGTYCRLDFERVDKVTKPTKAPIDLWAKTAG